MQIICIYYNFVYYLLYMILGFLGKGGSGKSSVATQVTLWLKKINNDVLAIDADHNMDLAYNIFDGNTPDDIPYFGSSVKEMVSFVGLHADEKYDQAFLKNTAKRFKLDPLDPITEKFTSLDSREIRVMAAGPQTDTVLYGQSCSHSLTTPLKVYLPLLELNKDQYVVVDEKAGADGVSTGIVTGIDVGIIVCEPALHSIKTAKQIAGLMDFYETPYLFVANKIQNSEDKEFITQILGKEPACYLLESSHIKRKPGTVVSEWAGEIETIISNARAVNRNNRLERTKTKFKRNKDFKNK